MALEVTYWMTLWGLIDNLLTGAFLSIGLMTNFLSLNEMFLISLQGKPIFGVNLKQKIKQKGDFKHLDLTLKVVERNQELVR